MQIIELRQKHKEMLFSSACRIYGITPNKGYNKQYWIDFLLSGGDFSIMLDALKQGSYILPPAKNSTVIIDSQGSIEIYKSDINFHANEIYQFIATVKNHAKISWHTSEIYPCYLSYHWYLENGDIYHFDGKRTKLSVAVEPGESQKLELNVRMPSDPGNYLLEITMVMEGQFWFEERGLQVYKIPVRVDLPKLTPYAGRIFQDLVLAIATQQ